VNTEVSDPQHLWASPNAKPQGLHRDQSYGVWRIELVISFFFFEI